MMVERLKNILSNDNEISAWKIEEQRIRDVELFYVGKSLDMNRGKDVLNYKVTVYKDFTENDVKYRGSALTKIHPTMSDEEIEGSLKNAILAAGYIKNEWYPLVTDTKNKICTSQKKFDLEKSASDLSEDLYSSDVFDKGCINSSEIFLNEIETRIINSEGMDVSFSMNKCEVEFITNWKEEAEEIELYRNEKFTDFGTKVLGDSSREMLELSREKALAAKMPALGKFTVLLTGEPVEEFFKYYYAQANAQNVYNTVSVAKVGESIQGEVVGDSIEMILDPALENSTDSEPFDDDGFSLKKVSIIEKGILNRYWGDVRFSYYLKAEPTGRIHNMVIAGGSKKVKELMETPYLEILAFSDFQMDAVTGDFGGEVRLARYFDGNKTVPVTGGSIAGNIKQVQNRMFLSRENQKLNNFYGPKTIQLFEVSVSGE